MSTEAGVQAIERAVTRGYQLCRNADDLVEEGVPYPDEMAFTSLNAFFRSGAPSVTRTRPSAAPGRR